MEGPHGHPEDNDSRWNSHTRNLIEIDAHAKYELFLHGPDDWFDGSDSPGIHDEAFNFIASTYNSATNKPKIAIVGFSRGAMIAQWVANDLSDAGIGVDYVGLMDPVDMAFSIPDSEGQVESGIKRLTIVGPVEGAGNVDYGSFVRMSLQTRIFPAPGNNTTLIARFFLNASHGSIGGTPGYNDEAEDNEYDYLLDRQNSITTYEIIVAGLLAEGIDIRGIDESEYGFPMTNSENTTD